MQTQQRNGSRLAAWRTEATGNGPVARGSIQLSATMLQELAAMAQAGQWSGTDQQTGQPFITVKWSGFPVQAKSERSPQMSGPIETPSETAARMQASSGGGGWGQAPAQAGGWGQQAPPAAATPAASQWGGPPAAAPPAPAAPQWGGPPAAAPPAAAPAPGGGWAVPPAPQGGGQWGGAPSV